MNTKIEFIGAKLNGKTVEQRLNTSLLRESNGVIEYDKYNVTYKLHFQKSHKIIEYLAPFAAAEGNSIKINGKEANEFTITDVKVFAETVVCTLTIPNSETLCPVEFVSDTLSFCDYAKTLNSYLNKVLQFDDQTLLCEFLCESVDYAAAQLLALKAYNHTKNKSIKINGETIVDFEICNVAQTGLVVTCKIQCVNEVDVSRSTTLRETLSGWPDTYRESNFEFKVQSDYAETDEFINKCAIRISHVTTKQTIIRPEFSATFLLSYSGEVSTIDAIEKFNSSVNRTLSIGLIDCQGEIRKLLNFRDVEIKALTIPRLDYISNKVLKINCVIYAEQCSEKTQKEETRSLIAEALNVINEAYAADPAAIHALLCNQVPCNKDLAAHPTVEVNINRVLNKETSIDNAPDYRSYNIDAFGLLNGVLAKLTGNTIIPDWSDEVDEDGRRAILGFTLRQ